ncbi:MAG: O-antigen ligase family protein, partial [Armatimonadetes bacterium]|nr:O-antigen ligase family protein [Candidatus Hippobium faecium]
MKKHEQNSSFYHKANNICSYIILALASLCPIFCGGFDFSYTVPTCLVLLICIYFCLLHNKENTKSKLLSCIIFAMLLIFLFMCIFSKNIYLSLGNIIIFGTAFLLIPVSSVIFKNRKMTVLFSMFLVFVCGCISVYIFRNCAINEGGGSLFWQNLFSGKTERIFGTFVNPNFYAGYLAAVFPVSAGMIFIFKEKKYSLLAGFFSVFILINLYLTGSKFGFIALIGGIIAMIICLISAKSVNKNTVKPIISVSVIFILFSVLFSPMLLSRIENAGGEQVHSAAFRVYTWKATFNMIKDNILLGVGPGRFAEAYPTYTIASTTKHAHCSYLQFASEYGIVLLLVFLFIIFCCIKNISKIKYSNTETFAFTDPAKMPFLYSGFAGGIISILIHNLADSDLYICSHLFILMIFCGIFLSLNKEEITPNFIKFKFSNLSLIYILACLWLSLSVIMFERQDYTEAYKIFPSNYYALRKMAKSGSEYTGLIYLKNALSKSKGDYFSYELLGDMEFSVSPEKENAFDLYEKALDIHPHSTSNMTKIIRWAEYNNRTDIKEKYYLKLTEQENSLYENLKGIPEMIDTSYADAHIYFGDKAFSENNMKIASEHYRKASERLSRQFRKENINFLLVSVLNGQETTDYYSENINK